MHVGFLRQDQDSWVHGSGENGMSREEFFAKFREVANTKQSNPLANVTSVEQVCAVSRAMLRIDRYSRNGGSRVGLDMELAC